MPMRIIGRRAWLWPRLQVPVYCTPFAADILIERKLEEAGLSMRCRSSVLPLAARFTLGHFDLEFVVGDPFDPGAKCAGDPHRAGHRGPTGDWKIDRKPVHPAPLDEARLREIGDEGVRALVCDSTNVLRDGRSPSEAEVGDMLDRIIARAPRRRVAITTFASHVGRIALGGTCRGAPQGREVVVAGRAMRTMIDAARKVGLLSEAGTFPGRQAFGYLPRDKVVLMCTGSQGEPRAALARIAEDTHPEIALEPGDLVDLLLPTIPGNEKAVGAVINNLAAHGVEDRDGR